jgi:hypothetical protein
MGWRLTVRHVFLELLELHPRLLDRLLRLLDRLLRLLDSLLRLLDSGLGATLPDRIDDQEDDDQQQKGALKRQLKSSKLHP